MKRKDPTIGGFDTVWQALNNQASFFRELQKSTLGWTSNNTITPSFYYKEYQEGIENKNISKKEEVLETTSNGELKRKLVI